MTEQIKLDTFLEEEGDVSVEEKGPCELPQDWKWVKLTDAVTLIGGGTPSKKIQIIGMDLFLGFLLKICKVSKSMTHKII